MFNVHLQSIIYSICCYILIITVFLKPVVSEITAPQNEIIGVNKDCVQQPSFIRSGSYSLEIKEGCDVYCVILDVGDNTSIINFTTSVKHLGQDGDLIEELSELKSPFNIKVYETTTLLEMNEEEQVLLKEWRENEDSLPYVKGYMSLSSKIFIKISGPGNWSHYDIEFFFEEIEYRLMKWLLKPGEGNQTIGYRPNSISLLSLHEPATTWSGIEIWFDDNLQIQTQMGEYILIGTGTEPFKDKHSRPLCITQVLENSTFFVDSSSAFVAFVSGPIQKEQRDFTIMWKGIKEKIEDEISDPMSILNSSLICFYNYSAAKLEFDKNETEGFAEFQKHFKETAKSYLPQEYKDVDLNKLSVNLFGEPTNKTISGSVVFTILIKVMYGQKSIFTWSQLQNIIDDFEVNSLRYLGYKVGKCPLIDQFDLPDKNEWNFVIYALVPVFGLFALMMWAWKQNLFAQNCLAEREEKLSFGFTEAEPRKSVDTGSLAEHNANVTSVPKVYRFDDEGRRQTLIEGSTLDEDAEAKATMVEMNALPPTSQEGDTLARFLKSQRSKSRPSLKSLLDCVDENNKKSLLNKIEGNESNHLYDSESSSRPSDETKL